MKAALFRAPGQPLSVETVDDPTPGEGQVVLKVGRCGICGTDLHMTSGHGWTYPANSVNGHEFAGEVVALGGGVSKLRIGDKITAMPMTGCGACDACRRGYPGVCKAMRGQSGGFAEFACVAENTAIKLPQALSLADGALVEPLAVGLHGVAMAKMRPGARVLVLGGGSVALAAIYWARRLGAGRIAALSRSDRRAALTKTMGADAFVAAGAEEPQRVADALGGEPEVVFECVGAVGMLGQAVNLVQREGLIVSMGFCTAPDPVIPGVATFKGVTIAFSMVYTINEFQFVVDTLEAGHLEPREMISQVVDLEALPDALEGLRAGSPQTKVHVEIA